MCMNNWSLSRQDEETEPREAGKMGRLSVSVCCVLLLVSQSGVC